MVGVNFLSQTLYFFFTIMAELALFSRLFGKQGSSCCDVRIEEIPQEEDREQVAGGNPGGSSCCGGPMPDVQIIDVGGDQVGIIGLREYIAEVIKLGLASQEQVKDELIHRVRQRNYIAPGSEGLPEGAVAGIPEACIRKQPQPELRSHVHGFSGRTGVRWLLVWFRPGQPRFKGVLYTGAHTTNLVKCAARHALAGRDGRRRGL